MVGKIEQFMLTGSYESNQLKYDTQKIHSKRTIGGLRLLIMKVWIARRRMLNHDIHHVPESPQTIFKLARGRTSAEWDKYNWTDYIYLIV